MQSFAFNNNYFLFHLLSIDLQGATALFITLGVLLVLNFIISGAEVALFSLSKKDLNLLKTKPHAAAKRIVNLLDEPKEVYASLLIAGTFVNISIIVLSNALIDKFISFGEVSFVIELLSKVAVIAFVIVFFGRILPKVWATQDNIRFAYGCSGIIEGLHLLLRRISQWFVSLADGIGKRAGTIKTEAMSIQEMDEEIDVKTDEEASPEEKNIMKGVVKFGNITVRQIMKSRLDVNGVDFNMNFSGLIKRMEELHYSRIPVYKVSLDNVVGIIHTKDLIPYLNNTEDFDWHTLMRQPFFVPEQKLIEDLLKDFQQKRIHFAIVVDEFGGTSGIVTMEDILEEVIGDIRDEFDDEESANKKIDDHNYIFEGKTLIQDACRIMKLPADTFDKVKGESDTVAGLLLEIAGDIPAEGSIVSCGDFDLSIIHSENNRIKLVKITINPR
ncbi:MAG: gliding motility-associated protein GldE [Bacteroidetes bacterium]|nr:gliding motility-associated protein GldE [Bacteroidota bacterium]